jgi:hypothetical protein
LEVLLVIARPDDSKPDPASAVPAFEDVPGIDVIDGELVPRHGETA